MNQSPNIPIDNAEFIYMLHKELVKIRAGCDCGFTDCCICESDYSIQWASTAVQILCGSGIITMRVRDKILSKLYDGHRG